MLLDRIDIDVHGPLHRVELGPFSEHLNVVCGPDGSGKTAIARFVRDSLVDRQYPLGMMSSSTGRVVWSDPNGMVHCRREKDGTPHGRATIEFEPRGDDVLSFSRLKHSWIAGVCDTSDFGRATGSLQVPEPIVDSVITDTAVTNVSRVVAACIRGGLDSLDTYRALPMVDRHDDYSQPLEVRSAPAHSSHRSLRDQLAEVEAEIARIGSASYDYQSLVDRRSELTSRLSQSDVGDTYRQLDDDTARQRLSHLCEVARQLRARQSELRRHDTVTHRDSPLPIDGHLRRQLDDLDAQMIGWRRTLLEIRGLREALVGGGGPTSWHHSLYDDAILRRRRLDSLLHWTDRYDRDSLGRHQPVHSYPYHPNLDTRPFVGAPHYRTDDIRQRVDSATRQIDWLLQRYASGDNVARHWYDTLPASASYRATTTLGDTLRAIRDDLSHVQQYTVVSASDVGASSVAVRLDDLRHCEHWLLTAIDHLTRHRETLLHRHPSIDHLSLQTAVDARRTDRDHELQRVTADLDACLAEAAEIRRSLRAIDDRYRRDRPLPNWTDREAVVAELRRIDDQLASLSRLQWLQVRRRRLLGELGCGGHPIRSRSPLSDAASRWLVRLSAGRLRRVDWPRDGFEGDGSKVDRPAGARIDGRRETERVAADRALAVMAVRMAAGELLAATGRQVPLLFETHRELIREAFGEPTVEETPAYAFYHGSTDGRRNHPVAAALHDYAHSGRQVIVLTSSEALTEQLSRAGASVFRVHTQQVVHPHRPLWRPHYQAERYVGPYPHTYGATAAAYDARSTFSRPVVDINRDFDMAWREAYGFEDSPDRASVAPVRTDLAAAGDHYRDGYYFADTYTTVTPQGPYQFDADGNWISKTDRAVGSGDQRSAAGRPSEASLRNTVSQSPFFLTVDSPIDQAPSIDAVAAARLRGLSVTHINHLMQQDSNRLADALGLASVDAATIRRWQAECRLVCRVPQLRGFDARVLVGCGVTDPGQLAAIHPVDLLQEVEAFLATERGQQILLSGSSHELSRITSWIAAANSSPAERAAASRRNRRQTDRRSPSGNESLYAFDSDRYEYESEPGQRIQRSRTRRSATQRSRSASQSERSGQTKRREADGRKRRSSSARRGDRDVLRYERDSLDRQSRASQDRSDKISERELRFYLQRNSPIVDAPSIGARMGERLSAIGIHTVDDLLGADPQSVATELDHRRVSSDTVLQWQQQAELVCRVPMLRGHDAQLLVMAEVTTPEELAAWDAEELFAQIDPIARSKEGRRVIRGGKLPDLEEVTEWIALAQHTRELIAA